MRLRVGVGVEWGGCGERGRGGGGVLSVKGIGWGRFWGGRKIPGGFA